MKVGLRYVSKPHGVTGAGVKPYTIGLSTDYGTPVQLAEAYLVMCAHLANGAFEILKQENPKLTRIEFEREWSRAMILMAEAQGKQDSTRIVKEKPDGQR